jgi:DNA-binding MarR family transcriptional regulator
MAAVTSVMRVQQLLLARIEATLQPYGLTFAAYEALRLLAFTRTGSMPMGKMGERLMVHPASVTNAIRRLEQRGLVERHTSDEDRRVVLATLTDAGRAAAHDATTALNQADFGIAALPRDETAQLTAMLRHVRVVVGDIADVPVRSSLLSAERSVVLASSQESRRRGELARGGAGGGAGEGELGEQDGDVVVEVAGMGAEPAEQVVGGCLQVGTAQRGGLLIQAEEPAGPVAGLEQPVGVEQQPVAVVHGEGGGVQVGMQAERRGERGRGERLELPVGGQPQRRGVPAVDQLDPACGVELGEDGGDEVLFARGPGHGQVDGSGDLG